MIFAQKAWCFWWQLFTEGVAMVFEQKIVGDGEYFHQDVCGWKAWCDAHLCVLAESFYEDAPQMQSADQRYFGDWVRFLGQPDTGYYLGARLVQYLLQKDSFERLIRYEAADVKRGFADFLALVRAADGIRFTGKK